ncbi:dTMP kinase [Frateuria defendens]|uniref:dTMP kinase n=1 Tax=Frateuria defendens TaxID=2219559 RepID=UPI00066FE96D
MAEGIIPHGLLIAVEGIDGAGKTTLAHTLAKQLRACGIAVTLSKEPTTGPWGTKLRTSASEGRLSPEEELRLLLLDRRQHVDSLIKPALARDEIVILDRYYPSTAAYQGAEGMPVPEILAQNAFAPAPDLTLILDLQPAQGLARIRARGDVPNHFETAENLTRCRDIFLTMDLPSRVVLDASHSFDQVHAAAWNAILRVATEKLARHGGDAERAERVLRLGAAVKAGV